ncbi:hypothetical protein GCM10022289_18410 [Pedobacter jeongneungensis]|uniref:Tryptophan-rich sensory protein n=1 Tax=Pedobacter jeongneungensis TaxID=947309 RepID=A0ABP8BBU4_9SPHI
MKQLTKYLPIANATALILTIGINYFSNAGELNGNTMKVISDRYASYFTPAGFAFSIWGLIYLGLLGFVCYSIINRKEAKIIAIVSKISWWFVLSCLANSFWVIAWLNDYLGLSVVIMVILLISLLAIITGTRMELDAHPLKEYLLIYWPFAIYAGWVTVALIANVSAYLTKIGWDGWGIREDYWAVAMIGVAGLVNVVMVLTRNLREFATVGIWALFAISVANQHQPDQKLIVYACYIVMLILLVFIIRNGLKNRDRSVHNM